MEDAGIRFESHPIHQRWFHLLEPTAAQTQQILTELDLPEDFFEELLVADQSPRLERSGSYVLLVMQLPWRDPGEPVGECVLRPLAILLGEGRIWSFSNVSWPFLDAWQARKFDDPRAVLVWFFQGLSQSYQRTISRLQQQILLVESRLNVTQQTADFYEMLHLSKALTRFYVALSSNIVIIFKVSRSRTLAWSEGGRSALNLAIADLQHARDRAQISAETAANMMDAYAGMVQININHGLKILTVLALVLYVPSLVATIFGVNVPLLEQKSHWTAWVALAVAFLISLVMSIRFKRRGWL
ncbi:MAG: magnesium transporter CorA family protein [Acidithiobacillus sp.]|nr:magnesium transporter CorA family protein [Acidithiobacillus sp.]